MKLAVWFLISRRLHGCNRQDLAWLALLPKFFEGMWTSPGLETTMIDWIAQAVDDIKQFCQVSLQWMGAVR